MKKQFLSMVITGLLVAGLLQAVATNLPLNALRKLVNTSSALAQPVKVEPAQADAMQIAGEYSGQVALKWSLGGVYSDTLAIPTPQPAGTPPTDLGSIDLVLQLNQSGNAVSGYIVLTNTLVFTREHTITVTPDTTPVDIGPTVQGTFDGVNLTLASERVALVVAGRSIQRQFRLIGAVASSDGSTLTGEYRETLWGYAQQPITGIGTFVLKRPSFRATTPSTPNYSLYLPIIQR